MVRPKWTENERNYVFNRSDNPNGIGYCWHCGIKIKFLDRKTRKTGWHIDHYPVKYSDIENQCCFGITDPKDKSNLVPSCIDCNQSHYFER